MKNKRNLLYISMFWVTLLAIYSIFIVATDFQALLLNQIENKFSGSKFGKIEVRKFPFPQISISNFSINEKFSSEKINITFSPLSLIKFSPAINTISFINSKYLLDEKQSIINRYEVLSKLFNINIANSINLYNLTLSNNTKNIITNIKEMNFSNNLIHIDMQNNNIVEISRISSEQGDQINISDRTDLSELRLEELYKDNNLISSVGNITFKDKISNAPMNLNFSFVQSQDSHKIQFQSDFLSGSGLIDSEDLNKKSIKFNIDNLDLNLITNLKDSNITKLFFSALCNLDLDIDININVAKAALNQINFLKNNITGIITKNTFSITDFSGIIDSSGKYNLSGDISNLKDLIFNGSLNFEHNDISFMMKNIGYNNIILDPVAISYNSNISINNSDIELNNIKCDMGSGGSIHGSFSLKNIDNKPNIIANLDISGINSKIQNYPLIMNISDYLTSLIKDWSSIDYLTKYIPIRKINYKALIQINLANIQLDDSKLDKAIVNLALEPNKININQLEIHNPDQNFNLSLNLDAESLIPTYILSLNGKLLNVDNIIINFLKNINIADLNSIIDKIKISGNILLDKVILLNSDIDKVNLVFNSDKNNIIIQKGSAILNSGSAVLEGNISSDPFTISLVYTLNAIKIEDFLSRFNPQIKKISGLISSNGKVIITPKVNSSLYDNFNLYGNFISSEMLVNNYSPDIFLSKILLPNYKIVDLEKDEALLYSSNDNISNIKGSYKIEKGMIEVLDTSFNTQYSSGYIQALINPVNMTIKLDHIISFYTNIANNEISKIILNLNGDLIQPQGVIDLSNLKAQLASKITQ